MKNIFKSVVSKKGPREEMQKVLITKTHLVASDSFTLLEVSRDCFDENDSLKLKTLDRVSKYQILLKPEWLDLDVEILKGYKNNDNLKFPDYKKVIPDLSKEDYYSVKIDAKKLINIARSLCAVNKNSKFNEVILSIPKNKSKPVVLERIDKKVIGLVMPMSQ